MLFHDKEHADFFWKNIQQNDDNYHKALFYTLGLCEETREHFKRIYEEGTGIKPECLTEGWQTGTTTRICQMAFNLFNDWAYDDNEAAETRKISADYTPSNLFCCEMAPYFVTAISLRFPRYTSPRGIEL